VIAGVRVGHWTDAEARTGCTAILLPEGAVASGEVRGGAPATREWALLDPLRTVENVDAVMLCGGSAFGLAAADGAVAWLEEHGRGFPTPAGRVPIVVAMALFDLGVGDPSVRPGAAEGRAACEAAAASGDGTALATGAVGAGAGATVARWRGEQLPGGLGSAIQSDGDLEVAALVAVNAFGELRHEGECPPLPPLEPSPFGQSTTLAAVVTNASLSKLECHLAAQSAHDGLARALEPVHTQFDGDAAVVAATGAVKAHVERVRLLAARAVEDAVRAALA
jgi:L-aminopeptidase/D-esterase-like protein